MTLILAHKKKIIAAAIAAAYVGLGIVTGDLTWDAAATKFIALIGLGVL